MEGHCDKSYRMCERLITLTALAPTRPVNIHNESLLLSLGVLQNSAEKIDSNEMLYKLPKTTSMPGTIHIPKKLLLDSLRRNPPYPPLGCAAAHRRPEFYLLNRSNPTYSS
jgi:hypothetical protein